MLKDLLLHIRYPYTAGIIATMWLGTAVLASFGDQSGISTMVVINIIATTVLAVIGFSGSRK